MWPEGAQDVKQVKTVMKYLLSFFVNTVLGLPLGYLAAISTIYSMWEFLFSLVCSIQYFLSKNLIRILKFAGFDLANLKFYNNTEF